MQNKVIKYKNKKYVMCGVKIIIKKNVMDGVKNNL